eukprot:1191602-Prorocentrum_minimum.AAC.6
MAAMAGPQGTTKGVAHDEDVAGFGQFYCIPCRGGSTASHAGEGGLDTDIRRPQRIGGRIEFCDEMA